VSHSVRLLAEWTAAFPYDFRDERVMAQVRQLTQRCVAREPQRRVQVSLLLQTLLERLTTAERFEEFVQKSAASKIENLHNVKLVSNTQIYQSIPKIVYFYAKKSRFAGLVEENHGFY
jgi:hypothetical protein